MDKKYLIYKHTNKINGKSYIGLTSYTIEKRWKEHVRDAISYDSPYHFHRAIRKYPLDIWEHSVVCDSILTFEDAKNLECHYVDLYDTYNNGYNSTKGGDGTNGFSPISSLSEEKYELFCKNQSINGLKARGSKKYTFYNKELNKKITDYITAISRELNLDDSSIRKVVAGKLKQTNGWYLWDGDDKEYERSKRYDFYNDELSIFENNITVKELLEKYPGLKSYGVYALTCGKQHSHRGWVMINEIQ